MDLAKANPEKRLFISLITRDISLIDAIIDLADNSVNAAMKAARNPFSKSTDFYRLFKNKSADPLITIEITFNEKEVCVKDDASGIDFEAAKEEVFRFGHSSDHLNSQDRLSVYGIGMKRAIFKIGNKISIKSDHRQGGFSMELDVPRWQKEPKVPWTIPIEPRQPSKTATGTQIVIRDLNPEIQRRLHDPQFEPELVEKLSKVYSYFIGRLIQVNVNGRPVSATSFDIADNYSHDHFTSDSVDCSIIAGIGKATGNKFSADTAGWFVFCNFRTVLYADKSPLTGWGSTLPLFQPKHRPFLGLVSFTSPNPEALPWTTTKGSINEDSVVWQEAKLRMSSVAKPILRFLDSRYSDEGTEVDPSRIADLSRKTTNFVEITTKSARSFSAPAKKDAPKEVKVQYYARKTELDLIRKYFASPKMSASEIGRKTFDFFLRNEVGGK